MRYVGRVCRRGGALLTCAAPHRMAAPIGMTGTTGMRKRTTTKVCGGAAGSLVLCVGQPSTPACCAPCPESNEALLEVGSFLRRLAIQVDSRWDAIAALCDPANVPPVGRSRSQSVLATVARPSVLGSGFFCAVVALLPHRDVQIITWCVVARAG